MEEVTATSREGLEYPRSCIWTSTFQAAMPGKLKLLNVDVSLSSFLYLIFVHKFNYLLGKCIIIILELLHETEVILPALRGEGDGHAPGA